MSLLYEVKFCSDLPFGLSTHPMTLDSKHSLSNEQLYTYILLCQLLELWVSPYNYL